MNQSIIKLYLSVQILIEEESFEMENKLSAVNSANTNFKMYKSGKRWLFACSMIISSVAAMGVATSVHADTATTNSGASNAQPQVTQTQAATTNSSNTSSSSTNSGSSTGSTTGNSIATNLQSAGGDGSNQTIKTYPNKSQIDQGVSQAKQQPNLDVKQDPDQEITGNSKEEIDQKIKDDYAKQNADLKAKEAEAQKAAQAKENYNTYNNSKGDTSLLDKTVNDAKKVPGLTVVKDADQSSTFNDTDTNGIRNWNTNTQSDYKSQSDAINNAVTTQKQNNSDYSSALAAYQAAQQKYREKLASWKASHNISGNVVSTADVNQQLILGHEPNAQHQINYVAPQLKAISVSDAGTNFDAPAAGAYSTSQSINGEVFQITYTNLTNSSYTDSNGVKHRIAKIVFTYSDLSHNNLRENGLSTFVTYNDPAQGFWYNGSNGVTVNEQFYDEYGNPINIEPGTGYLAVTSLNAAYGNPATHEVTKTGEAIHVESATVLSGGSAVALLGSSIQVQGNTLVSPATNDYANDGEGNLSFGLKDGYVQGPQSTASAWQGDNWDGNSNEAYWGTGLINLSGNNVTVRFASDTKVNNEGTWATTQTIIPQTPGPTYDGPEKPNPKMASVHYHYDTAKIKQTVKPGNVQANYHYDYVNYTPTTEKHFTDGAKIADNQVFADGSIATATIKTTLPVAADIDGGLKNFTITEDYSNFAKYVNKGTFKVMNGTQDVTSQWSVSDDGNGKAVLTLIDPSKANGETITVEPTWTINTDVPNGTEFVNNATATVNNVPGTPSTSKIKVFTQNPTKDVEMGDNVQGDTPNSINGQVVAAGSTVTYPLSDKNGLPANREQQVTSHVITDNLDSALNYVSYKAYLPDKDGKLQDVTSHVLLTQDGQKLTFTDDSYLLGLYNQDPSVAFALPIIDLVVKANNDTKVIPNSFDSEFTYKDENGTSTEKKTSNTVNISTYTPTATKDVELGDDVQGDTSNTIAGSLVEAGTLVTWPMSTKSLPANRAQDVVSHTETENLDSNLSFVSFKAYLPDKDGKLQDVTSHVQMKQDGQKLTFTDDATLIKQYNANKKAEQALPVIDLVTKVNGQSKLIPNDFDSQLVFKDGQGNTTLKTTSNKVSIKTATAPNPVKEDLDEKGKNVDGQEVTENQHLTMQLDWDLSNDKGVNATPEMIKKGFYFADPLDAKALEAGDLSKAQVLDQNGNKVSGISFHKYNSLSEAPEFIQEQIKDNDLAGRFNGPFVIAQADDPQAFFDKYVKTGSKLKVQIPVTVKKGFKGSFSNTAYQFGFGKATPTNTVTNFVKPTPKTETPKSSTPSPKSTPATPSTPESNPVTPMTAPEQPAAPVSQPTEQQAQLPQTGNSDDAALIGLAAAALIGSVSLAGLDLRKH